MTDNYAFISENYKHITDSLARAADQYTGGKVPEIMAVTKTVPPEIVNYAASLGIKLIGENRVQEYLSKQNDYSPSLRKHFIGNLQTNKAKYIVGEMELIQSVGSLRLAKEINRCAIKKNIIQDVLIQINIGGEESKGGVSPDALEELLHSISDMKNISVKGLMTIPPPGDEKYLYNMQCLFLDISSKNIDNIFMDTLSMGMSSDYLAAVKYGSTVLRIGTALFGSRTYR